MTNLKKVPKYEQFIKVCEPISPYFWKQHTLNVIMDGHDFNGKRYHVVKEQCYPHAVEIDNAWVISGKSEDKDITLSDIHMIRQYVNLDEGFEDIAPKYFSAEVDICLSFHLSQLKYHRESVEKWLERLEGELYDQLDKE